MKKILIVEDNPMNMELILDLLEFYGYDVTEAEDGIKALERLAERQIRSDSAGYAASENGRS